MGISRKYTWGKDRSEPYQINVCRNDREHLAVMRHINMRTMKLHNDNCFHL